MSDHLLELTRRLLDARGPHGHWEGWLSISALSTATAVIALSLKDPAEFRTIIAAGLEWLAANRNADGGWGDTVLSISNISTTALVWAAFTIAGTGGYASLESETAAWMQKAAGSPDPATLTEAIARRYGKDRTFSVPILTVLALACKLGPEGWTHVTQLPFELAALPQRWFQLLGLPVVSYALPALIAIGQLRHHRSPTRNPLGRALRNATRRTTLNLLDRLQPSSGGFLEAIPLTSFVVMSLAAANQKDHPVVQRGIDFLRSTRRPDGSWAIDSNLATWVTTLSVNALGGELPSTDRARIVTWLLDQQGQDVHRYTLAAPGAWAWTDLPGGVPDADDTAGAILALHHLAPELPAARAAAIRGIVWLADLQNSDGGIPTFCRGWTKLPFDRSSPDLTAHTLLAWSAWHAKLPRRLQQRIDHAILRAHAFLEQTQRPDGSWAPLWFGNQHMPDDENPVYGTARVLIALNGALPQSERRALDWLLHARHADGGWGGGPGVAPSIEETALALHACAVHRDSVPSDAIDRACRWLIETTKIGTTTPPSPIGFYFARLWYFEELYPLIFSVAALRRAQRYP